MAFDPNTFRGLLGQFGQQQQPMQGQQPPQSGPPFMGGQMQQRLGQMFQGGQGGFPFGQMLQGQGMPQGLGQMFQGGMPNWGRGGLSGRFGGLQDGPNNPTVNVPRTGFSGGFFGGR
jgi:hypothetical protein